MAAPDYFVGPSIATDDTATFMDRETGVQELAVTLTRTDDGAPDARHPVTLAVDLDVTDDVHVVVRHNGTEVNGDVPAVLRTLRNILTAGDAVLDVRVALDAISAELEARGA